MTHDECGGNECDKKDTMEQEINVDMSSVMAE